MIQKERSWMTELMQKLFTVSDAAGRACGRFIPDGDLDPDILSVSIDSRTIRKGDLFIALKGEFTDGHNYISMAFEAGASSVMISDEYFTCHKAEMSGPAKEGCFIVVEDTLLGFHRLAASWVADFDGLIRIAVTGSSGKSTTKEMIGAILAEEGSTVINEGNLNSETGLPLSVLNIDEHHKYGVFEMGINHPGEMKALAAILNPDYAMITNIGTAHIGFLGSQEAIAVEKSDIFSLFDENHTGFIFEDDTWAEYLQGKCPGKTVLYGPKSTEGIQNAADLGLKGWEIQYRDLKIDLKLVGQHNLNNAIASISLAEALGVAPSRIKTGLEKIVPLKGRSQIIEGKYTVIEDSYNANGESMSEMFNFISQLDWSGRIVLVLGSMKELGASSEKIHRSVGLQAVAMKPELVFFFGEEMMAAYEAALNSHYAGALVYIEDYSELEKRVLSSLEVGDLVLLKGSRSMNLDKLAGKIVESKERADV